jgi:integrase
MYSKNQAPDKITLGKARSLAAHFLHKLRNGGPPAPAEGPLAIGSATPGVDAGPVQLGPEPAKLLAGGNTQVAADGSTAESLANRTLEDLCNWYLEGLRAAGKQSAPIVASHIRRHISTLPLARTAAADLTSNAAAALIRQIKSDGKARTARHVRAMLHAAYARAIEAARDPNSPEGAEHFGIQSNPIASVKPPLVPESTEKGRNLSWEEFGTLWRALYTQGTDPPLEIRFLRLDVLLGGQRCEQLMRCTVDRVDLDDNTILLFDPKGRREHPRPHLLPLLPLARTEVIRLIRQSQAVGSKHLFPGLRRGKTLHTSTLSKFVNEFSAILVKSGNGRIRAFSYRDLRRTIETRLASLDVPLHIRGHLQSHGLGGVQTKHYDMRDYMPQKRQALDLLVSKLCEAAGMNGAELPEELRTGATGMTPDVPRGEYIFFDTEFTQFREGKLLSIGLVTDDERSLYIEVDEPLRRQEASDFCVKEVLSQFGLVNGAIVCSDAEAGTRIARWLENINRPRVMCYDFTMDWQLLVQALQAADAWESLSKSIIPLNVATRAYGEKCIAARDAHFRRQSHPERHHALVDATALRAMWRVHTSIAHVGQLSRCSSHPPVSR